MTSTGTSAFTGPFLHKYIFKIPFCDCIHMKINMLILYIKIFSSIQKFSFWSDFERN